MKKEFENIEDYEDLSNNELCSLLFDIDEYMNATEFQQISKYKLKYGKHTNNTLKMLLVLEISYVKYFVKTNKLKNELMIHYLKVGIQRNKINKYFKINLKSHCE